MKEKNAYLIVIFAISFLLFLIPIPKKVEIDFYDLHVLECQEAHAQNMSYSLCSGFWYEPTPEDIPAPCVWHPSEDPYTIPHGSNLGLGETIIVFGIYGWLK